VLATGAPDEVQADQAVRDAYLGELRPDTGTAPRIRSRIDDRSTIP
jgi:hypothetical protein